MGHPDLTARSTPHGRVRWMAVALVGWLLAACASPAVPPPAPSATLAPSVRPSPPPAVASAPPATLAPRVPPSPPPAVGSAPASPAVPSVMVSSSNAPDHPDFHPSVAEDPAGRRLVAAWVTDLGNLDKTVRVATSTDGGASWSPETVLFAGRSGDYLDPTRLTYDSQGSLHLVFMAGLGDARRVYHRVLPPGADPLQPPSWRHGGDHGTVCANCLGPELVADGHGHVYVLYEGNTGGNHLGLRRTSGASGVWEPARRIVRAGHDLRGALAVTADGRLHLAYLDVPTGTVFYARYPTDQPGAAEAEQPVSTARAEKPAIAVGGDGRVHLVWEQGDRVVHRVVAHGVVGAMEAVSGPTDGAQQATVAADAAGTIYVSWTADSFKRIYQNRQVGGAWQGGQAITGRGVTARFQRYGVSPRGAVELIFVEQRVARVVHVASAQAAS